MKVFLKISVLILIAVTLQGCNLLSAAGISSQGQPIKEVSPPLKSMTNTSNPAVDHSLWDQLLKKHVSKDGWVDYKGFNEDKKDLKEYLSYLGSHRPYASWEVQELLAYYINLYNAATVNQILENYPVESIKDISGVWTKGHVRIWDRYLSLGGIENGILRKMNEPRIHFAINCASISCPKLLNEAYSPYKINEQLDLVTREFINSDKNDISSTQPKLSSIFDWYQKDYKVSGEQNVIAFINNYSDVKIDSQAVLEYKEYNWNLNEQK